MCNKSLPMYSRYYLVKRTIDNVFGSIVESFESYFLADKAYEKIDYRPGEIIFYSIEGGW